MATLTHEQVIRDKVEATLSWGGWHNLCPLEQAVEGTMRYRNKLGGASLQLFDGLILKGVLPENAAEAVQYAIDQGLIPQADTMTDNRSA
jgi:hypothetical protein